MGEHVESMRARRAVITEDRERLRRLDMIREEVEKLEREIAEYERKRGIKPTRPPLFITFILLTCYDALYRYPNVAGLVKARAWDLENLL